MHAVEPSVECRWTRMSDPQAIVTYRQGINGLILTWQPGIDPYGQYNCVNQMNITEKQVIFLAESK